MGIYTATARHSHTGASHVRESSPDTHRPSPRAAASPSRTGHRPRTNQQQTQSAAPSRPSASLPCPPPNRVRRPTVARLQFKVATRTRISIIQRLDAGAGTSLMPSSTRLVALLPRRPSVPLTVHWTHDHCARLRLSIYARAVLSTTQGWGMFALSLPITQPVLTRDRAISPFCPLRATAGHDTHHAGRGVAVASTLPLFR